MDEEANKQTNEEKPTRVIITLGNGQPVGPTIMYGRDSSGIIVQAQAVWQPKSGKAVEADVPRFIPYSTILWVDFLPNEKPKGEEGNDGGTES